MSARDEHIKLSVSYFNIAAAGSFVAAVATVPLTAVATGKLDLWSVTHFMTIFLMGSAFLHGLAQLILTWAKT